jgi:putative monooxygenase
LTDLAKEVARTVAADDVEPNRRRGGDIRVLLSPKTVGSTSGFMGVLTLQPGERVAAHTHPYSEEFFYVVRGAVTARVGDQHLPVGAGEALMVPIDVAHSLRNDGGEAAVVVFHLSPLAPRPELGHRDLEPLPALEQPGPTVQSPA